MWGNLTTADIIYSIGNGNSDNWYDGYTHSIDNTQAHTDYLINSGADESAGQITATEFVDSFR